MVNLLSRYVIRSRSILKREANSEARAHCVALEDPRKTLTPLIRPTDTPQRMAARRFSRFLWPNRQSPKINLQHPEI